MSPAEAVEASYDVEACSLVNNLKNVSFYDTQNVVISRIEGNTNILADAEEVPPAEIIYEYHHLVSQANYWKNKHNDLMQAFKILSAYDIDVDYTELLLRTREAARYRKEITSNKEWLENNFSKK